MRFCFLALLVLILVFSARATIETYSSGKSKAPSFQKGSFSVILRDDVSPETLDTIIESVQGVHASSFHKEKVGEVSKRFTRAFKGFTLHGASDAMIEHIEQLPEVEGISPMRIYQASAYNWGLDRIDQAHLPLDGTYSPLFDGTGVDVYVADTGLDTLHQEFATPASRVVENIFNAYGSVTDDTDDDGHGTHCAGTVGGATIGVSPGANIFGAKVLSTSGGTDETISEGLEAIMNHTASRSNPAIISMSLGGGCYQRSCSEDPYSPLTLSVEAAMEEGIVVVVAAGNDNLDACFYTPASIPGVITIGASDINDDEASFSSYGPCTDLYAPGVDINSACAEVTCGDETSYIEYSGTSMATPHVSGVVAQILENNPSATIEEVRESLQCSGVSGTIDMTDILHASYTPNILLQIPSSSSLDTCNRGENCPDDCSQEGFCDESYNRTEGVCMCISPSTNLFEDSCSELYFGIEANETSILPDCGNWSTSASSTVSVSMFTSTVQYYSWYGWYGSAWSIFNTSEVTMSPLATNTLDFISFENVTDEVCLMNNNCYKFGTSSGLYHFLTEWEVCGVVGGELFTGDLCIDASGSCSLTCESDAVMFDVWDVTPDPSGYTISSLFVVESTTQQWSNSVKLGGANSHNFRKDMCLKKDTCYDLHAEVFSDPSYFSMPECGLTDVPTTLVQYYQLCIDEEGNCTSTFNSGCSGNQVPTIVDLHDTYGDGWDGGILNLLSSDGNVHSTFALDSGSFLSEIACLEPDNYTVSFDQPSYYAYEIAWELCGRLGGATDLMKGSLVIDDNSDCYWTCEGGKEANLTFSLSYLYDNEFQVVTETGEVIAQDYLNSINMDDYWVCIDEDQCGTMKLNYYCNFNSISSLSVSSYKSIFSSSSSSSSFHSVEKVEKKRKPFSIFDRDQREQGEKKEEVSSHRSLTTYPMELCGIDVNACSNDYVCVTNHNCVFEEIDAAFHSQASSITFVATVVVTFILFFFSI